MVICFIVELCVLPENYTMVKLIDKQGLSEINPITSMDIHEVKNFHAFKDNGFYESSR
jgi:hypothetical protein